MGMCRTRTGMNNRTQTVSMTRTSKGVNNRIRSRRKKPDMREWREIGSIISSYSCNYSVVPFGGQQMRT